MKRKLSLIVLVAMVAVACFGILTACNSGLDEFALTTLLREVGNQISKAQGNATYTLDTVVKMTDVDGKEISCAVKWEKNKDSIKFVEGDNVVTVTVPEGVESYILTGTLVDEHGNAYQLDGKDCSVQEAVIVIRVNQDDNQGDNNQGGGNEDNNQGDNNQGDNNQGGGNNSESEKVTLTLNPNYQGAQLVTQELDKGSTNYQLPNVKHEGYTLDGWYTEQSGGIEWASDMPITNDLTLYAQWTEIINEPEKVTLTLNYNYSGAQVTTNELDKNSTYSLPNATRDGYTFDGWFTQATGGDKKTGSITVSDDLTLYAQWTEVNNGGNQGGTTPSGEKGTQGNPYTVTEALAVISGLEQGGYSAAMVYTTGVVSDYVAGNQGQYKCSLSDAGSSSKLTVWYANLGSGVTSFKDGDTIVVYGYLMRFWDNKKGAETPEITSHNDVAGSTPTIVSVNAGTGAGTGTGTGTGTDTGSGTTNSGTLIGTLSLEKATPTSSTSTQKVYSAGGITVTNDKASSGQAPRTNADPSARFYKSSTIKIECTTAFSKIVITADDYEDGIYLTGFDGMTVSGATITSNGSTITIELSSPATSFQSEELASQLRIKSIQIYA